jgi:hypothetical protein
MLKYSANYVLASSGPPIYLYEAPVRVSDPLRDFSVLQDPLKWRTVYVKCGLYLRGPSATQALLDGFIEHPAGAC